MKFIAAFIFCLATFVLPAQNLFNKQYVVTFTGYNYYYDNHAMQQTSDGRYIVCRSASDSSALYTAQYYEFEKLSGQGTPLWSKRLYRGNPGPDLNGNVILQTSDGGFMLATSVYVSGVPQIVLVKTDGAGNALWSKTYPGLGGSLVHDVKQTADSGYVVCGSTSNNDSAAACLFHTDVNGNYDWGKWFLQPGDTSAVFYTVLEIPGQGYIACGSTRGAQGDHALALRTDLNGNTVWAQRSVCKGELYSAVLLSDSTLVFGGMYFSTTSNIQSADLFKTDLSGNMIWQKGFVPSSNMFSGSYTWAMKAIDTSFVIAGYVSDPIPASYIARYGSSGVQQWGKEYHATYHTFNYVAQSIEACSDGGYALSTFGGTYGGPGNDFSYILLKTEASGDMGCDGAAYIVPLVEADTFAFVQGILSGSCGTASSFPVTLENFQQPVHTVCETIFSPDPEGITENRSWNNTLRNDPNPFNTTTAISFETHSGGTAVLEVYDLRGAKVFSQEQEVVAGKQQLVFDRAALPAGMYAYTITIAGERMTGRMIVE